MGTYIDEYKPSDGAADDKPIKFYRIGGFSKLMALSWIYHHEFLAETVKTIRIIRQTGE